jgi:hypothetical protein
MLKIDRMVLLLFAPAALLAQSMVTHLSDGSTQTVTLSSVAHLRFTSSMAITLKSGGTTSYPLSDIRTLTFNGASTSALQHERGTRAIDRGLVASAAPNPFVSSTTIRFSSDHAGVARVAIFDGLGKLVRRLVAPDAGPGEHALVWDARDDRNERLPPGSYVASVECGSHSVTTRMVISSR